MKKLFTICTALIFSIFLISCGSDDVDCTGTNFSSALSAESNALVAATQIYAADPTNTANCNTYKDALQNYLEALKPYKNCANNAQEEAEIEAAIEDAQQDVDDIDC